jgi:hypothetical protein
VVPVPVTVIPAFALPFCLTATLPLLSRAVIAPFREPRLSSVLAAVLPSNEIEGLSLIEALESTVTVRSTSGGAV